MQTAKFTKLTENNEPRLDHGNVKNKNGHGTMVASKVVGEYGVTKNAIMIPVQMDPDDDADILMAYDYILADFAKRKKINEGQQAVSRFPLLIIPAQTEYLPSPKY